MPSSQWEQKDKRLPWCLYEFIIRNLGQLYEVVGPVFDYCQNLQLSLPCGDGGWGRGSADLAQAVDY